MDILGLRCSFSLSALTHRRQRMTDFVTRPKTKQNMRKLLTSLSRVALKRCTSPRLICSRKKKKKKTKKPSRAFPGQAGCTSPTLNKHPGAEVSDDLMHKKGTAVRQRQKAAPGLTALPRAEPQPGPGSPPPSAGLPPPSYPLPTPAPHSAAPQPAVLWPRRPAGAGRSRWWFGCCGPRRKASPSAGPP